MDVREKLVELLTETRDMGIGFVADNLIAHGVTVQEWIPVTERLPDESGMYIVAAKDGHAQRITFVIWQKRNKVWNLTGARSYWKVTHWMPLPDPPKGE